MGLPMVGGGSREGYDECMMGEGYDVMYEYGSMM